MIWVGWLALTLALAWASRRDERVPLLIIAAGLAYTQIGHVLHDAARAPFSAVTWIVIGYLVATTKGSNSALAGLCLLASGGLKFPARFSGMDYGYGNPYLAASDICGILALLLLGWPVISSLLRRGWSMVARRGTFVLGVGFHTSEIARKTSKIEGRPL